MSVGRRAKSWRGGAARLGIFAILFQALLFGWHHHPLPVSGGGHSPAAISQNTAPPNPAVDEDGCDICSVLHHQSAAPLDLPTTPPPLGVLAAFIWSEAPVAAQRPTLAFHARAPPLA